MNGVPDETIHAFARTILREARHYGFSSVDTIRLIGVIMDMVSNSDYVARSETQGLHVNHSILEVDGFPLKSSRLQIRPMDSASDLAMLERWIEGKYGQYFLLSCATAQRPDLPSLLANPANKIGIIELRPGQPIGVMAFLDIDPIQRRAELRKLIGEAAERGKGYAEEAMALWIEFGRRQLRLEKVYLSTLQTHLRNIKLNEAIGFRVEGVLRAEVRLGDARHDVLRMGLSLEPDGAKPLASTE